MTAQENDNKPVSTHLGLNDSGEKSEQNRTKITLNHHVHEHTHGGKPHSHEHDDDEDDDHE